MDSNVIYAKSEKNGSVTLLDHSVECAKMCNDVAQSVINEGTDNRELIIDMCVLSGMFHDIGKVSSDFQRKLRGENIETVCAHNVASVKFLTKYVQISHIDRNVVECVYGSIANHHPIPSDKKKSNAINSVEFDESSASLLISELVDEYNKIRPNSSIKVLMKDTPGNPSSYTEYYMPENGSYNVYLFITGNILKYSDILVSSACKFDVGSVNVFNDIDIMSRRPKNYDERFELQYENAEKLSKFRVSCFNSQTGFGKTMLGLMYIMMNKRRAYWICPRNTVARSVYKSVCEEIDALGLSDKVSVALLLSNVYESGSNDSDIIVTNIDNYMRPQFKTDANIRSFDIISNTCIFDEFHEFMTQDAILASYDVAMTARKACSASNTLLLSATPIRELYSQYIDSDGAYIKFDCEKILSRKKRLIFGEKTIPASLKGMNYYVCTNSVSKCQEIYLTGASDNVIHARFTDDDRMSKMKLLYSTHGKQAYKSGKCDGSTWSGNRVVSTGCDVSFNNSVFYNAIPEMFVQGLGRNDRWGMMSDNGEIPLVYMVYNKNGDRNEKAAVSNFYDCKLSEMFYNFMLGKFGQDSVVTMKDIYDARDEFYSIPDVRKNFLRYFGNTMLCSFKNLSNINYSYSSPKTEDNQSGAVYISNRPSLRQSDGTYAMWVKTYGADGEPTMEGVMQADDSMIDLGSLFGDSKNVRNIVKVMKKNGLAGAYFKNDKAMEKLSSNLIKFMESMKMSALSSDTPMILCNVYGYDKNIGFFKNNSKKA